MADRSFLQWPFLEDLHRELAENLEAWAQENLARENLTAAHESQRTFRHSVEEVDAACKELVQKLARGNWLDYCVAESGTSAVDYGGRFSKPDVRSLCIIRETLARHSGLADFAFAMQGLGSASISLFASEKLRKNYLPAVREGGKIAAFALSEPDAGSDVAAMSTRAEQKADEYILNGTKTWISNGGIADYYTVFARTEDSGGTKGISAFVVDAETPGLEIAERIEVIAPHPLATLEFRDCRIPVSQRLGEPGQGFKIAMATLDIFRTTVGAAALGFARRALDEALERVTTRKMFGDTMSKLPLVQAKLGDMALDCDAAALLIYRSAWTKDTQAERVTGRRSFRREASMAKLYATEAAQRVIDAAVQLFGGLGVKSGMPVEKLYRDIRALRIYEGASEVQQLIIGGQTLAEHKRQK